MELAKSIVLILQMILLSNEKQTALEVRLNGRVKKLILNETYLYLGSSSSTET